SRKYLGALLLGLYKNGDLIYVGRTGGGFNDRTLAQVHKALKPLVTKIRPFKEVAAEVRKATWVEPRLVCEVRFNEWTSDKKLRAPIFQGFRDDVDPEDCRLEDSLPERGLTEFDGRTPNSSQFGVRPSNSPTARPSKIEFTNLDKLFWPED